MRDATPSAIYLKDYRKPDYLIDTVDLEFDLQEGQTKVRSHYAGSSPRSVYSESARWCSMARNLNWFLST